MVRGDPQADVSDPLQVGRFRADSAVVSVRRAELREQVRSQGGAAVPDTVYASPATVPGADPATDPLISGSPAGVGQDLVRERLLRLAEPDPGQR